MLDSHIRPLIDPVLNQLAKGLDGLGISANQVTLSGFLIGLMILPVIWLELYGLALIILLVNRMFDGLDGALARIQGTTDLGGYLDIVLDFIFYSAVVFAFCLAQPENAIFGAFLIFSFVGTGSAFLAFAIQAEKRGLSTTAQGKKSFYYLGGLAEGFETILVLGLMCIWPTHFWVLALTFGVVCWCSVIGRLITTAQILR